jgi:hypothetical protein
MLYALLGTLPWLNTNIKAEMQQQKECLQLGRLYRVGRETIEIPIQMAQVLRYIKSLRFEDKPDYNLIYHLLNRIKIVTE